MGITGTGGAGKSSLTDELIRRLRLDVIDARKVASFDLIVVETPCIDQGDAAIAPLVDVPIYVIPEFGTPTTNGRAPSDVFVTSENLLGVMDRVTYLHTRINKS